MPDALCIDLYAGLGGWAEGFLAEGYRVVGFDIERHRYPDGSGYPGELVLQDVTTLHGRQLRDAAVIVASPPCQEYSYMAMPWRLAKSKVFRYEQGLDDTRELTRLFDTCFRLQREASDAAGRHIPMVVENVRGAQRWVGRAKWRHGSYYLWGDVPALMPFGKARKGEGSGGSWFHRNGGNARNASSRSKERKHWTAIASKIPYPLAVHIARAYKPTDAEAQIA